MKKMWLLFVLVGFLPARRVEAQSDWPMDFRALMLTGAALGASAGIFLNRDLLAKKVVSLKEWCKKEWRKKKMRELEKKRESESLSKATALANCAEDNDDGKEVDGNSKASVSDPSAQSGAAGREGDVPKESALSRFAKEIGNQVDSGEEGSE